MLPNEIVRSSKASCTRALAYTVLRRAPPCAQKAKSM